jgi:type II secretory pathway component PulJ
VRIGRAQAFTLIEVMISGALMALILVSAYLCFNAATSTQKAIEPRVEMLQMARVALGLMAADLREACPLDKQLDLLGMHRMLGEKTADNLDFATHNYTPRRPGEGDFCQESFYLDQEPESGQVCLYRRRNPRLALEPMVGGSKEELARGVAGLRFEYYDGLDWYDSWGDAEGRGKPQSSRKEQTNLEGLPEAVRITLWLEANPRARKAEPEPAAEKPTAEPPLVFQTVARLNLAASARDSLMSGASSQGDGSDQSSPAPNNSGGNP